MRYDNSWIRVGCTICVRARNIFYMRGKVCNMTNIKLEMGYVLRLG